MRNRKYWFFGGLGTLAVLIVAGTGLSQMREGDKGGPPGMRFGSKGGPPGAGGFSFKGGSSSGGSGGAMDPSFIFNRYSNGKDVITISEVQSRIPQMQEMMRQYAERTGITNGQLTRDQFGPFFRDVVQPQLSGRGGSSGGSSGGSNSSGGSSNQWDEERSERRFAERDSNKDGLLSQEEASDTLRAEFSQWDKNQNGVVDWEEYKEYSKARSGYLRDQNGQNSNGSGGSGDSGASGGLPEEDKLPTVYKVGNLPKELPSWFGSLDKDKDAQVGLYEWKDDGRTLADFRKIDANLDGFITVEESLRTSKQEAKEKSQSGAQLITVLSPNADASSGRTVMGPNASSGDQKPGGPSRGPPGRGQFRPGSGQFPGGRPPMRPPQK